MSVVPPQPQSETRLSELEGIRGIAALLVVFFHIPKWGGLLNERFIDNGNLMVQLFFVMSGFVIHRAYADRIRSLRDAARFQFLRFGRLYPVHLLFLTIFAAIECAKISAATAGLAVSAAPFSGNTSWAFVQQVFLLQAFVPGSGIFSFNRPAWSIGAEFYTYAIFAAFTWFFGRKSGIAFAALGIASLALLYGDATFGLGPLWSCLAGFSVGCLTEVFVRGRNAVLPRSVPTAAFAVMVIFIQLHSPGVQDLLIYLLSALLISSVSLAKPGAGLNRLLRSQALAWLGKVSYSVYMSHYFVIWFVVQVFKRVFAASETAGADGARLLVLTPDSAATAIACVVGLTLVVSHFVNRRVEEPLREWSRRVAST